MQFAGVSPWPPAMLTGTAYAGLLDESRMLPLSMLGVDSCLQARAWAASHFTTQVFQRLHRACATRGQVP